MSAKKTAAPAEPTEAPAPPTTVADTDEKKAAVAKTASGDISIADALAILARGTSVAEVIKKQPVAPPAITDKQKAALARIPDLYGKVTPTTIRLLTDEELRDLVEERQLIDDIVKFLNARKTETIRETLAYHLDLLAEADAEKAKAEGLHFDPLTTDAKGEHYAVKQDVQVPDSEHVVARTVTGGKPVLTIAAVEKAHKEGLIDRPTYLAITKTPEVSRVLDSDGMAKAIKKDPSLLFRLADLTDPVKPGTTITVK